MEEKNPELFVKLTVNKSVVVVPGKDERKLHDSALMVVDEYDLRSTALKDATAYISIVDYSSLFEVIALFCHIGAIPFNSTYPYASTVIRSR